MSERRATHERFEVEDLTIAINTLDRPDFLWACVESLLETTPVGVSLQVLFNGSEAEVRERTIEQVADWPGPTKFIHLDEIAPIDESHNTALAAVETRLVNFMGDDDVVLGRRIPRIIDEFNRTDPTPAVVTSFARRIAGDALAPTLGSNKDLGPTTVAEWRVWHESGTAFELLWPGAVLRVDALRAIGGWELEFAPSFDNRIFSQMSFHGPVLAIPDRQFGFRIHQGSLSTSRWKSQREIVRFVAACHRANIEGRPEPTLEQFQADEKADPLWRRYARDLRDQSGLHFRVGGAKALSGDRAAGAGHLAASAALWPPNFVEKVRDQVGRGYLGSDDYQPKRGPEAPALTVGSPTVVILLKNTNQYRLRLYELLRATLQERGINLRLILAQGLAEDRAKGDQATISWAEHQPLTELNIAGRKVLWQPAFKAARDADLVITEQASKQLFNIALAFGQGMLKTRHAFWGHGKNFQAPLEGSSGEGLKRKLTERAHWFFAYNEVSRRAAIEAGMPEDRVTSVMNSTDTTRARNVLDGLGSDNEAAVRAELGLGDGPVVVFVGGLYPPKRPEFLIEAAKHLRAQVANVEFVVIGDGSLAHVVNEAAQDNDWIHAIGAQYGDERIRLSSIASLQMMPGMVGLNIVDAFAVGVPTVTTDIDYHSPEIEYLVDDVNGLIVTGDPTAKQYADAVADLLRDPQRLALLREGAYLTGGSLSVEDMATRLADGIEAALAAPRR